MARIRTIKPEFPQSESLGRVSREARLLFVLLWTICDDAGRTRASSRMLASLLYPYDDDAPKEIDPWLEQLESEGCVRRYKIGGTTYLDIPKWLNHQKIDRPSPTESPVVILIPLVDGSEHPITEDHVAEFAKLYPSVDVPLTLNQIRGWNLANPKRRKSARGVMNHVNAWLSKEQDK